MIAEVRLTFNHCFFFCLLEIALDQRQSEKMIFGVKAEVYGKSFPMGEKSASIHIHQPICDDQMQK